MSLNKERKEGYEMNSTHRAYTFMCLLPEGNAVAERAAVLWGGYIILTYNRLHVLQESPVESTWVLRVGSSTTYWQTIVEMDARSSM